MDPLKYDNISTDLCRQYTSQWIDILKSNDISVIANFLFIPTSYVNNKGGFHSFIFCNKELDVETRLKFYESIRIKFHKVINNDFKPNLYVSEEYRNDIYSFYKHLFDIGPLKTMMCLLPFAQKSRESRQYRLLPEHSTTSITFNELIKPTIHLKRIDYDLDDDFDDLEPDESVIIDTKSFDQEVENILNMNSSSTSKSSLEFKTLGRVGKYTLDFVRSLIYLSDEHIFIRKMSNHDDKFKIVGILVRFLYTNYIIEHNGNKPSDPIRYINYITYALLPIMRRTITDPSIAKSTERDQVKSIREKVFSCYKFAVDGKDEPSDDNNYSEVHNKKGCVFNENLLRFWSMYSKLNEKSKKRLSGDELGALDQFKRKVRSCVSAWTNIVVGLIMDGITDEIRPFIEVDERTFDSFKFKARDGVTFNDVIKCQPNVDKSIIDIDETFYIKTMRLWTLMFIYVVYYNSNSITETIRSIISAFVRYYIWIQKKDSKNPETFIYNIHQTQSLTSFPYNQWIRDEEGDNIRSWIKTIYLQFIKKELLTINKCERLMPFLTNLSRAGIPISDTIGMNVKPLANFDQDMDRVYKNILSAFTQERFQPPRELSITDSPFFPMRNGILEFLSDGNIIFHTNNHEHFMNANTNVLWEDNYDPNDKIHKQAHSAISKMISQIYPKADEREFILRVFSSVLYGKGMKDQFIIQYGTGSDGKTTFNNAINGMLGIDGVSNNIQIEENGKLVNISCRNGLATSMKTETILSSSKNTHDEGGIINLKDKRFCSVQEPDPALSGGKLNCSRIKDILSGTQVTGRHIYKSAESFVPGCLITLQTNIILGYSEDSDAVRRRITFIKQRSKFTTHCNEGKYRTLEYSYPANTMLNSELATNPKYWQALFYILLPYARDNIKNKCLSLSNIERPLDIINSTNESFAHSNGIIGWFNSNIIPAKNGFGVIHVPRIVDEIIRTHNSGRREGRSILISNIETNQKMRLDSRLLVLIWVKFID